MKGHEFCGEFIYPAGLCHREPGHPKRHNKRGDTMTVWLTKGGYLHLRASCSGGPGAAGVVQGRQQLVKVTYVEFIRGTRCRCLQEWKADWQRSEGALKLARRKS